MFRSSLGSLPRNNLFKLRVLAALRKSKAPQEPLSEAAACEQEPFALSFILYIAILFY